MQENKAQQAVENAITTLQALNILTDEEQITHFYNAEKFNVDDVKKALSALAKCTAELTEYVEDSEFNWVEHVGQKSPPAY